MARMHDAGRLTLATLAAASLLGSPPAKADVIDGDWCHDDGRQLSIKGSRIVTPRGKEMAGDYTRHSFRYVVPDNEPGSGQTVSMTLLNETTVRVATGSNLGSQTWQRCKPTTS